MFDSYSNFVIFICKILNEKLKEKLTKKDKQTFSLTFGTLSSKLTDGDFPALILTSSFELQTTSNFCNNSGLGNCQINIQILSFSPFEGIDFSELIFEILNEEKQFQAKIGSFSVDNTTESSLGESLKKSLFITNIKIKFHQIVKK